LATGYDEEEEEPGEVQLAPWNSGRADALDLLDGVIAGRLAPPRETSGSALGRADLR
jgi:hypothetical protein